VRKGILIAFLFIGLLLFSAACGTLEKKASPISLEQKGSGGKEEALSFPPGVPVLMYHEIGREKNNNTVISPELFQQHMAYLYEHNYTTISLEDLYGYIRGEKGLPPKPVVITFDDGYRWKLQG